MGFTVKLSALRVDDFNNLLTPVVFCVDEKKLHRLRRTILFCL